MSEVSLDGNEVNEPVDFEKMLEGFTPLSEQFLNGNSQPESEPHPEQVDMGNIADLMKAIHDESNTVNSTNKVVEIPQEIKEEKKGVGKILEVIKTFFMKLFRK